MTAPFNNPDPMIDCSPDLTPTRRACATLVAVVSFVFGGRTWAAAAAREHPAAAAVRGFLLSLEQPDPLGITAFFVPDAQVFRLRRGELIVSRLADVVHSLNNGYGNVGEGAAVSRFREPVENVGVKAFGRIATVWTDYQVFNDGVLHHSGHTVFSLLEQNGRWRITNITDEATRLLT